MKRVVNSIISNYYGSVKVYVKDNKYYLTLEDYGVEMSKDLAVAIKEYFKTDRKIEKIVL